MAPAALHSPKGLDMSPGESSPSCQYASACPLPSLPSLPSLTLFPAGGSHGPLHRSPHLLGCPGSGHQEGDQGHSCLDPRALRSHRLPLSGYLRC